MKILIDKEIVELAIEWIEAQPEPRMIGALKAISDLRQALEQPTEQEPIAFINVEERKLEWAKYIAWDTPTVVNLPKIPLYTQPPRCQNCASLEEQNTELDAKLAYLDGLENGIKAEREACAKLFDDRDTGTGFYEPHEPAEIIRARGKA